MKAITRSVYGPAASMTFDEVPMPEVGENDVLVKMHASSVNPYDWHLLRGEPYLLRLSAGFRRPKNHDMGIDAAGTVVSVGAKVTRFTSGDNVFGIARGAFAEYAVANEDRLAAKPDTVAFEAAASIPCAGNTALVAVRDKGKVGAGMSVLVNGASGGVGSFAVQLATSLGAEVTGVCSTRNVELVKSIGAVEVVDYTRDDFARLAHRYDVVIDTIGNRSLRDCSSGTETARDAGRRPGGGSGKWFRPMALLLKVIVAAPFVRQQLSGVMAGVTPENLETISALMVSGDVTPLIDRTYELSETPVALGYLEEGHARGKVIITV